MPYPARFPWGLRVEIGYWPTERLFPAPCRYMAAEFPASSLEVDGIVTSGSVFDVADVSKLQYEIPSTPQTNLVVTASVHCPVRQFGSGVDQNFDSLFQMRPDAYIRRPQKDSSWSWPI